MQQNTGSEIEEEEISDTNHWTKDYKSCKYKKPNYYRLICCTVRYQAKKRNFPLELFLQFLDHMVPLQRTYYLQICLLYYELSNTTAQ